MWKNYFFYRLINRFPILIFSEIKLPVNLIDLKNYQIKLEKNNNNKKYNYRPIFYIVH